MENLQMQIDFNLMEGICKMLEVISKEPIARRFAYTVIICLFIAVIWWKLPDVIMAFK